MTISKISIVIPTYNYGKFIVDAIESVLNQSYEGEIEIIVVDDGSTDNTRNLLSDYMDRIIYMYQENSGPSRARNQGMIKATGDYIGFLDADDVFQRDRIKEQISVMETDPSIGLCYSDYYCVDRNLKIMESYKSKGFKRKVSAIKGLLEKNYINTSTVLMKREVVDNIGLFEEEYDYLEDLDYWLRVAMEYRIYRIERFLVKTRSHGYNLRRQINTREKLSNGKEIIAKYKRQLKELEKKE